MFGKKKKTSSEVVINTSHTSKKYENLQVKQIWEAKYQELCMSANKSVEK